MVLGVTGGRGNATGSVESLNVRNGMFLGNRYESTAAASDASDPPAEKYEYQAEVQFLGQESSFGCYHRLLLRIF